MATSGPNSPGTVSEYDSVGLPWSNPGNIVSSNNSYATRVLTSGNDSNKLIASNFGFSIPAGSTINGILVEVECKASAESSLQFENVILTPDGTWAGQVGDDKNDIGVYLGTTDAYKSYGGAADSWGRTWTPTEINASGFGVILALLASANATGSIDHVRVTVYYTAAGGHPAMRRYGGTPGMLGAGRIGRSW